MDDNEQRPAPGRAVRSPLPPSLTDSTGFLLSWVSAHATERFNGALAAVGLTAHQLGVLTLLVNGPMKQARLSEQLEVFQPVMVTLINELETAGFVRRTPNPGDRRAIDVHLEPRGAERLAQAGIALEAATGSIFGKLPDADRETLHRILLQMVQMLDPRQET